MIEKEGQIVLNLEDIQAMFSEKDMQILRLRSMVRDLLTEKQELEEKSKPEKKDK